MLSPILGGTVVGLSSPIRIEQGRKNGILPQRTNQLKTEAPGGIDFIFATSTAHGKSNRRPRALSSDAYGLRGMSSIQT